jgi:uncharacterized protein
MKLLTCLSLGAALFFATSVAPPAHADEAVDPEALATAKKIQEVTHASALGDQVMAQMMKVFTNGLNQTNPGRAQDVSDILNKLFLPAFHDSMPALLDESARTYARHFTAAELKQLLAFYQTPIGQKMIAETPGMAREQMVIGQAFAQKIVADIRQKLLDAIKEKGLQAPQGL